MKKTIDFITKNLNIPIDYVEPVVKKYVEDNNKQELDSSDVKKIITIIAEKARPMIGSQNNSIKDVIEFNESIELDDLDDFDFTMDNILDKEKNKKDILKLLYLLGFFIVAVVFSLLIQYIIMIPAKFLILGFFSIILCVAVGMLIFVKE